MNNPTLQEQIEAELLRDLLDRPGGVVAGERGGRRLVAHLEREAVVEPVLDARADVVAARLVALQRHADGPHGVRDEVVGLGQVADRVAPSVVAISASCTPIEGDEALVEFAKRYFISHGPATVNDFAWATAKKFVWQATRATIPGKGPVPIHMYYLPGRANLFRDAGQISRHALEFYSKLWFPYQFPQLTLQDGPSAGMEYPMVINSNRGAADHEAAHQWWPMVVGNNETVYGWMDEGFNQYMNILSRADTRGTPAVLDSLGQSYGRVSGNEAEAPMMSA